MSMILCISDRWGQIKLSSKTRVVYETFGVRPLGVCSFLSFVYKRLRRRDGGPPQSSTDSKSHAHNHFDCAVVHGGWFGGHAPGYHGHRIHFDLDGAMEWHSNRHD